MMFGYKSLNPAVETTKVNLREDSRITMGEMKVVSNNTSTHRLAHQNIDRVGGLWSGYNEEVQINNNHYLNGDSRWRDQSVLQGWEEAFSTLE
jgi:hypothetical protein